MRGTSLYVAVVLAVIAGGRGPFPQASAQTARSSRSASSPNGGIEGTWNFSTLTPLERPAEFGNRGSISLADAAAYEKQVIDRNNADRRDGPADTDVARAYNEAWFDRGTHMAILNGMARTSLIVEPADGRMPALTADATRRQATRAQARREHPADGPEDRSLAERCLSFNAGPPMMPGPYNNYVQIFVFADHVVVFNEMIHDARIIPTDGRPHAPAALRRFLGDSIGRWEGQTLVVDTTNFTNRTSFRGASDRLHLVERFSRANADTLLYEFSADDPTSFTKPWRVELPMKATDEAVFEYACHEGNEALAGILRGARFEERQAGPR